MKTRAAVLHEMGHKAPFAASRPLRVEEVDLQGPGPGEVLVEVVAAGLCHSDLSVIDGSRPRPMPMVLGHETAGVVRELGPDVRGVQVGDHVIFSFLPMCGQCVPCQSGRPVMCVNGAQANAKGELLRGGRRFSRGGQPLHHHLGVSGFSQLTVAAQESLIVIDKELPLQTAALFGCAVVTGAGAVLNTARVEPGSAVAVFGMGGVGLSAVMGARCAGAYPVIAVDMLPHKLELARQMGATHTLSPAQGDAVTAIKDLTGGGAACAIEAVGSAKVLAQAYQATARGGVTVSVGLPDPAQRLELQAVSLVAEERTLKGSYMGSAVPRRDIPRYIALYRAGLLPVDRLFTSSLKLDAINDGFDALAKGEAVRQVVDLRA